MRVILLLSLLGLTACATQNQLPEDFDSSFEF